MTAVARPPAYLPPMERFRRLGGDLVTARVTSTGRVVVHHVRVVARPGLRGTTELWPTSTRETVVGVVDPDETQAWFHAEVALRRHGYAPDGDWTTVDRLPAVRLRRVNETTPGTAPGVN